MAVSQVYRVLLGAGIAFVIFPHLNLGLLSDYKICGDSECESPMSRVQAIRDYHDKDCRFLNFRQGETIFVYHKLTGKREDLWAGSIDRKFGYFPKDAVQEQHVLATMEKVVETQASDFFCMDDSGYPFDSSHLDSDDDETMQSQESETSDTTLYMDDTNTESPSTSEDVSEPPLSAQEADNTFIDGDESENGGDAAAAGTHKDAPNEQGGSASSSWFSSSVTGWLGLATEEEPGHTAEGEKKDENKETQAEASFTSSVTDWLGLGGERKPEDAVEERVEDTDTADSFTSTMTGWLGFGGEKKAEAEAGERENDKEQEPAEKFRSRKMSLDLEGSQLHKEEEEEMGTLKWLGNGLSNKLWLGLTNQESEHETTNEREVEKKIEEEEQQPVSSSWFDTGIVNILGFRKDKSEVDGSTGSDFKDTDEDDVLQTTGNVDTNQSQAALTEEVRTETSNETKMEETLKDQNVPSEIEVIPGSNDRGIPAGLSDSIKDSVLPEDGASKDDQEKELEEKSQPVDGMPSALNSFFQTDSGEEEDDDLDDIKTETNILDGKQSAEMENKDHQIPKSTESAGRDDNRVQEVGMKSVTDEDFSTQSNTKLVPDFSSVDLNSNSTGQSAGEKDKTGDKVEDRVEIPNQTDATEKSADMSPQTAASSDDSDGEGNDGERGERQREISMTQPDETTNSDEQSQASVGAEKSSRESHPVSSSGTAQERNVPVSGEEETLTVHSKETSDGHSDSLDLTDSDTQAETHQGELGQEGKGHAVESSFLEFGSSHSTNISTEVMSEDASEEDRTTFYSNESTTQTVDEADQDYVSLHNQQSDGDSHMQERDGEDATEEVEESTEVEKQGETEELKEEQEGKAMERKQEVEEEKQEEVEESMEEERKQDVKGMKEVVKEEEREENQEAVGEIKGHVKQNEDDLKVEMEELKDEEVQEAAKEMKEDKVEVEELKEEELEPKDEEVQEAAKEMKEDKVEVEEFKEEEPEPKDEEVQEAVKEIKEDKAEVEELKEEELEPKDEEVQEAVKEMKEDKVKVEEFKEEEPEPKDEEVQEAVKEMKEDKAEVEKLKEEEPQPKDEEVQEAVKEMKEDKVEVEEFKKEEKQQQIEELKEKEKRGALKEVDETKEKTNKEGDEKQIHLSYFRGQMENSLHSSPHRQEDTEMPEAESKGKETIVPETSKQTEKRENQNPEMEDEKRDGERREAVVDVEGKDTDEEESLKCLHESCPQASNDVFVRDEYSTPNKLSLKDEGETETGKQSPVADSHHTDTEGDTDREERKVDMKHDDDVVRMAEDADMQMKESDANTVGSEFSSEADIETSALSHDPVESQAVVSEKAVAPVSQHPTGSSLLPDNKGTAETESGGAFGFFKNTLSFFSETLAPESAAGLDSNMAEASRVQGTSEQDSAVESRTDPPIILSQQQPQPSPPPFIQTPSPSLTQTHSHPSSPPPNTGNPLQTKALSRHYKSLLAYMSVDEMAILKELIGRHKLQFLDYVLGSSDTVTDHPDNDESILLDIERLLHHHREALVAPSASLKDAPLDDEEKTRTLQKLEMLLARVRETFNTGKSDVTDTNQQAVTSCVGESCSTHKDKEKMSSKMGEPSVHPDNTTEQTGVDKEEEGQLDGSEGKERMTEGGKSGEKGKRSEEESVSPVSHPHVQPGLSEAPGVMKQILDFVHQTAEDTTTHVNAARELLVRLTVQVVSSLPDDMRPGPDLYGVPWEPVIISSFVGVKSRMYRSKERWMAEQVAQLLDEKCQVLETLSKCQQEYDDLENSLRDSGVLAQTQKKEHLEGQVTQLGHAKRELERDLEQMRDQLDQQKEHRREQEKRIAVLEESMKTLEEETKDLQSQDEQAQTTLKVYNMNSDRLQRNLETAGEENTLLHESNAQLRQQVEGWAERVSELEAEMSRCEVAHRVMLQDVANKDERIMSLTDRVLSMKAWDSDLEEEKGGEEETSNGTAARGEENGRGDKVDTQSHLQKVQKLIYAAKLNADLKSVDEDKDRAFAKLNDEVKAKEDLFESIKELENEKLSLQSDTEHYSDQVQRLQQKLHIMTEMYQENELKLHRLLTVEEKERLQKEEKLNKADKNIALAMEELNNYRQRAAEMEEELEKTKQSYQTQISAHEKKAHNNWLAVRAADRELADIRRENALLRQKLTDTQFKLDTIDKDPFALESLARPLPFRAERSPYGPSPLGRPASETRAFLSPPTLMDGPPARLSPRVPRGPLEPPGGQGEMERSGGPHSDSGSISPTWERDRRGPPPGPPGPLGPPGYMFPEPGVPMYRRPPPPPGALGFLPPPGSLPPGPLHPRSLPPGPPHPADMADGTFRENSLGPGEQEHRESGPGDRRTPPEGDPRMFGPPPSGPPMGPLDGPFPRRAPYGPPPPDYYPPRGPGGPPMMPVWAPPPPGVMFPPRFPPGGPPHPHPHHAPPMRPPLPDGLPPTSMGPLPPQQSLPSPPHSQSPEEHIPSPEDAI